MMCSWSAGLPMEQKHSENSLRVSEESHTGLTLFIPFCFTQGCDWIGEPHFDKKASAVKEGALHLVKRGVKLNVNWGLARPARPSEPDVVPLPKKKRAS